MTYDWGNLLSRQLTWRGIFVTFIVVFGAILLFLCTSCRAQWTSQMDSIARKMECEYKFPHGISHAFAERESYQYDPNSFRTEANYVESNSKMAQNAKRMAREFSKKHGGVPSYLSELYQLGSSWGIFQMLGANFRAFGCKALFLNSLTLEEQFQFFAKMFQANLKRWGTVRNAISAWNHGRPFKNFDAYAEGPRGVLTRLSLYDY